MTRQIPTASLLISFSCLVDAANFGVEMSAVPYSCCSSEITFDKRCENTFSVDGMNIAHYSKRPHACAPPCERMEDGLLKLENCSTVNVITVCTDTNNVPHESRSSYQPEKCSGSVKAAGNSGSGCSWLLLLLLLAVGCSLQLIVYL